MKTLYARSIPCYAADTAGVCSALFELGGMTVVHDASGCNSTYATHDEPRWFNSRSMIYISALTENDVVMGNDEKFISDTVRAAQELKPRFIALCNSPIPMMVGCDMEAIACEIKMRSNIPCFAVRTNGMDHYWRGAAEAWLLLAKQLLAPKQKTVKRGINILGATPLDFSLNGNVEAIRDFLEERKFNLLSIWAMNCSWEDLQNSVNAELNLVIANSGLPLAEYMFEKYDIPYVCGIPLGKSGAEILSESLENALKTRQNDFCCRLHRNSGEPECTVVAESVFAGSLAMTLQQEMQISCNIIDPLAGDQRLLAPGDLQLDSEKAIKNALRSSRIVIADNMYDPIIEPDTIIMNIPHEAFSGRCYHKARLNLVNREIEWEQYLCRK